MKKIKIYWRQHFLLCSSTILLFGSFLGDRILKYYLTFIVLGYTLKFLWMAAGLLGINAAVQVFVGNIYGIQKDNLAAALEKQKLTSTLERFEDKHRKLLNNNLKVVSNVLLKLSERERISLYRVHEHNFTMIARYSPNPTLVTKGRVHYKRNEGFIAKALQSPDKKYVKERLCDPSINFDKYYNQMIRISDIPKDVVIGMNVKARSFAVYALANNGVDGIIAVAVIESLNQKFGQRSSMDTMMQSTVKDLLLHHINENQIFEPDTNYAYARGF